MKQRKQKYSTKHYTLYNYNTDDYQINPDGSIGRKEDGWDNEGYYGDLED